MNKLESSNAAFSYQLRRSMYGRHPQHHLAYQKFLHFPYPEIFVKPHHHREI